MFQISVLATPRNTASTLSVLAAIGAAGMASQAVAAPVTTTLELSEGARCSNAVNYGNLASAWTNWATLSNWSSFGSNVRGYIDWNVDLAAANPVTDAKIKFRKISEGTTYGIPDGSNIEVALITQDWSGFAGPTYPNWGASGPSVSVSSQTVLPVDPNNATFLVDVTSLFQTWQASPSSYFGIRFYITNHPSGGIGDPLATDYGQESGELVLTTDAVPEPGALGLLALGGLMGLRRRRR